MDNETVSFGQIKRKGIKSKQEKEEHK